jgi:L-lactate utilization protein LutB
MNIEKAIENLKRHGFTVTYFETGAQAADYMAEQISGKTVGMGGSQTATELGLYEKLEANNTVYWHHVTNTRETINNAANAQVYISSANAIAETGEIVNIDGSGNRVSATMYGPEKVYIVAGVNKLAPDLASAIDRARNVAAPLNTRRLHKKTPCALGKELKCYDCNSPDRICRGLSVLYCPMSGIKETEVILINASLGF